MYSIDYHKIYRVSKRLKLIYHESSNKLNKNYKFSNIFKWYHKTSPQFNTILLIRYHTSCKDITFSEVLKRPIHFYKLHITFYTSFQILFPSKNTFFSLYYENQSNWSYRIWEMWKLDKGLATHQCKYMRPNT